MVLVSLDRLLRLEELEIGSPDRFPKFGPGAGGMDEVALVGE